MSEHYDFHYQPTGSGAISGQQVLQQTEDAINELGDYVNDNVGGAMDVAQQALETAQTAETNAQTALDTANSFSSAIQSAQQDASTALSTAQTAQTTASNANNTAIQAQQDASSAVTTANNASGQVSTLSGTVTTLGQRVTTAEGNIGQNTSDITALGQRVTTAEGNITTLQNDVSVAMGNASSAMATAGQVKQQAFVFRYSSTALVASSTNSNTLLDNTDNLKVGDKVIDSSGVLFSITAIDAANSTFTIGTALIDLAQDSDVVHKSGDETVDGVKRFTNDIIRGSVNTNSAIQARNLIGNTTASTAGSDSSAYQSITATLNYSDSTPSKSVTVSLYVTENAYSDGRYSSFRSSSNNLTNLGTSEKKWANVYATNYYYGNDNVEFSTKFVTTDTAQTIGGVKTFTDNISLKRLTTEYGVTSGNIQISFSDKNNVLLSKIMQGCYLSGLSYIRFHIFGKDSNNQSVENSIDYSFWNNTSKAHFRSNTDNFIHLGTENSRWAGVYAINYYYGNDNVEFSTKFVTTDTAQTISGNKTFSSINGVEPSSLSLPDLSNGIDISSYLDTSQSSTNYYTPPANGWISISINTPVRGSIQIECSGGFRSSVLSCMDPDNSNNYIASIIVPCIKNDTATIYFKSSQGGTIKYAKFFPCQGNV